MEPTEENVKLLREEPFSLAERGKIKESVAQLKKTNFEKLEKIKRDFERKQLEETNEFITESLMENLGFLCEEQKNNMQKELSDKELLKSDTKNIVGQLTPYIPYIELVCSVGIVAKRMLTNKNGV